MYLTTNRIQFPSNTSALVSLLRVCVKCTQSWKTCPRRFLHADYRTDHVNWDKSPSEGQLWAFLIHTENILVLLKGFTFRD